jgi:hypothetical protein
MGRKLMKDLSKYNEIIIWGACLTPTEIGDMAGSSGKAAEKLYKLLEKNGYQDKIVMWADSNKKIHGLSRFGKPIVQPSEILGGIGHY